MLENKKESIILKARVQQEEEAEFKKELKGRMQDTFKVSLSDKVWDAIFRFSREEGHAYGYTEVESCAYDIVNIVAIALNERDAFCKHLKDGLF